VNTEPYRSLLPHPVFKHNDYLGVTTILTQGGTKALKLVMDEESVARLKLEREESDNRLKLERAESENRLQILREQTANKMRLKLVGVAAVAFATGWDHTLLTAWNLSVSA
jgi:hypothetical protein